MRGEQAWDSPRKMIHFSRARAQLPKGILVFRLVSFIYRAPLPLLLCRNVGPGWPHLVISWQESLM